MPGSALKRRVMHTQQPSDFLNRLFLLTDETTCVRDLGRPTRPMACRVKPRALLARSSWGVETRAYPLTFHSSDQACRPGFFEA